MPTYKVRHVRTGQVRNMTEQERLTYDHMRSEIAQIERAIRNPFLTQKSKNHLRDQRIQWERSIPYSFNQGEWIQWKEVIEDDEHAA